MMIVQKINDKEQTINLLLDFEDAKVISALMMYAVECKMFPDVEYTRRIRNFSESIKQSIITEDESQDVK